MTTTKTVLNIFDFDGTLFRSPTDTPENRKRYEKATGLPWLIDKEKSRELSKKLGRFIGMRRGWFGREETLMPPLVPDPAPKDWFIQPILEAFFESKNTPEALTVILTGRHAGLKKHILRICADGGLLDVHRTVSKKDNSTYFSCIDTNAECILLGEDGPAPQGTKPNDTISWKFWIIEQYFDAYPELCSLNIWEDRQEHVTQFQKLQGSLCENVVVHHVT